MVHMPADYVKRVQGTAVSVGILSTTIITVSVGIGKRGENIVLGTSAPGVFKFHFSADPPGFDRLGDLGLMRLGAGNLVSAAAFSCMKNMSASSSRRSVGL